MVIEDNDVQESDLPLKKAGGDDELVVVVKEEDTKEEDTLFVSMFTNNDAPVIFESMVHVDAAVDKYQEKSGLKIVVKRSEEGCARLYFCASHDGCCFRAKFGRVRCTNQIVFKKEFSCLFHCGQLVSGENKPRANKRRLKFKLALSIDKVAMVKDSKPVAKDVIKTAANFDKITVNYNQAWRSLCSENSTKESQDILSFQLIRPYLSKFHELNQGTVVNVECDPGNHVNRIFLCPGIMKETMKYVRPMMSLDATHLKSRWGGILYVASVKTGCDEIYPVAFAIMKENENAAGWLWFLENLHNSIPLLVSEHPRTRVMSKYFSFISDRQKGLIPSLLQAFPDNHCCYCAIHIARNTESSVGKGVAKYVHALSCTFSHRKSAELMTKIEQKSPEARAYLEGIPPHQWKGTAWIDDETLPPRFGITTTNMSEATNSMLESARDCSWFECIDTILKKMMNRIVINREKHKGKSGVVENMLGILQKRWENCAGFQIVQIQENGTLFNITRQSRGRSEPGRSFTIDIANKMCECGQWQEHCVPCVDAIAYYKLHENRTIQYIMDNFVDIQYTYGNISELLKTNIVPVCLETITFDGCTLPPRPSKKRSTGRPKKVRIRKRSRWAHEPEKSSIVCSRCKEPGHNVRTCLLREELGLRNNGNNHTNSDAASSNDLNLS